MKVLLLLASGSALNCAGKSDTVCWQQALDAALVPEGSAVSRISVLAENVTHFRFGG